MKWLQSLRIVLWISFFMGIVSIALKGCALMDVGAKAKQEIVHQRFLKMLKHAKTSHDSIEIMLHFDLVE